MRNSNQSVWPRIVRSPVTLVIGILLFIFLARAVWNVRMAEKVVTTKLREEQAEIVRLQDQKQDLAGKVEYLSTKSGIETELRSKYRAVRPGESVAVIVDDASSTAPVATSTPKVSWWNNVLGFFGL